MSPILENCLEIGGLNEYKEEKIKLVVDIRIRCVVIFGIFDFIIKKKFKIYLYFKQSNLQLIIISKYLTIIKNYPSWLKKLRRNIY